MKKCPICEKTFEDSVKFCQYDGSLLAEEEAAFDPYATIVGLPKIPDGDEGLSGENAVSTDDEGASSAEKGDAPSETDVHLTVGSVPIEPPDEVLDIPDADPLKTKFISEAEMREALEPSADESAEAAAAPVSEHLPSPEPPAFIESEMSAKAVVQPPPSPFDSGEQRYHHAEAAVPEQPAAPSDIEFDEAATIIQSEPPIIEPSKYNAAPIEEWTPPPPLDANWQEQQIGENIPFNPPPEEVTGQNKTLAIVSLVSGILSILCCSSIFVVGLAAIVTGFMAKSKASSDPIQYGGSGMALGGIITGAISLLFGVLYWILLLSGFLTLPSF